MSANGPHLAGVADLIGDPARANMLQALMDGRALTAKELAWLAGVAPQTASGHLAKLLQGGLLAMTAQGRHRYYRLAGPEVAAALEGLMVLSGAAAPPPRRLPSRVGADLSRARTCYDHFAGRLGVAIHDALLAEGHLQPAPGGYALSGSGEAVFRALGVEQGAGRSRRAALRPCLDWSERKPHLAGELAAALACRCFETGWVTRRKDSRAVDLTQAGRVALTSALPGFVCDEPDALNRRAGMPPPVAA